MSRLLASDAKVNVNTLKDFEVISPCNPANANENASMESKNSGKLIRKSKSSLKLYKEKLKKKTNNQSEEKPLESIANSSNESWFAGFPQSEQNSIPNGITKFNIMSNSELSLKESKKDQASSTNVSINIKEYYNKKDNITPIKKRKDEMNSNENMDVDVNEESSRFQYDASKLPKDNENCIKDVPQQSSFISCSSESSSEFPLSSTSEFSIDEKKIGNRRNALVKNTLPSDSFERALALINQNNCMSSNEKIEFWNCSSDLSDVEDVNGFDIVFRKYEDIKRSTFQNEINANESILKEVNEATEILEHSYDFTQFRLKMMQTLYSPPQQNWRQVVDAQEKPSTSSAAAHLAAQRQLIAAAAAEVKKRKQMQLEITQQSTTPPVTSSSDYDNDCKTNFQQKSRRRSRNIRPDSEVIISSSDDDAPGKDKLMKTTTTTTTASALRHNQPPKTMSRSLVYQTLMKLEQSSQLTPSTQEGSIPTLDTSPPEISTLSSPLVGQKLSKKGIIEMRLDYLEGKKNYELKKKTKEFFKTPIVPTDKTTEAVITSPKARCRPLWRKRKQSESRNVNQIINSPTAVTTDISTDVVSMPNYDRKENCLEGKECHQQHEFCNYLGLTGMSTANAVANAVAELANCNMARRSLRVRRLQHQEKQEKEREKEKVKSCKEDEEIDLNNRECGGLDSIQSADSILSPNISRKQSYFNMTAKLKKELSIKKPNNPLVDLVLRPEENIKKDPEIKIVLKIDSTEKIKKLTEAACAKSACNIVRFNDRQSTFERTDLKNKINSNLSDRSQQLKTPNNNALVKMSEVLYPIQDKIQQILQESRRTKPSIFIVQSLGSMHTIAKPPKPIKPNTNSVNVDSIIAAIKEKPLVTRAMPLTANAKPIDANATAIGKPTVTYAKPLTTIVKSLTTNKKPLFGNVKRPFAHAKPIDNIKPINANEKQLISSPTLKKNENFKKPPLSPMKRKLDISPKAQPSTINVTENSSHDEIISKVLYTNKNFNCSAISDKITNCSLLAKCQRTISDELSINARANIDLDDIKNLPTSKKSNLSKMLTRSHLLSNRHLRSRKIILVKTIKKVFKNKPKVRRTMVQKVKSSVQIKEKECQKKGKVCKVDKSTETQNSHNQASNDLKIGNTVKYNIYYGLDDIESYEKALSSNMQVPPSQMQLIDEQNMTNHYKPIEANLSPNSIMKNTTSNVLSSNQSPKKSPKKQIPDKKRSPKIETTYVNEKSKGDSSNLSNSGLTKFNNRTNNMVTSFNNLNNTNNNNNNINNNNNNSNNNNDNDNNNNSDINEENNLVIKSIEVFYDDNIFDGQVPNQHQAPQQQQQQVQLQQEEPQQSIKQLQTVSGIDNINNPIKPETKNLVIPKVKMQKPSIYYISSPKNQWKNPIVTTHGRVLYIYYEMDTLITVQEFAITFWKYSKFISTISVMPQSTINPYQYIYDKDSGNEQIIQPNEWSKLGECKRLIHDSEIHAKYPNRICVNNSMAIYIELRYHTIQREKRECNLLSMYVNLYYYNDEEMLSKTHSIQLDTVQSAPSNVVFTTIQNSRYFIMAWPQENILGKIRTGMCKYSLTPQVDTLASIREFKSLRHEILYLDCCGEDKLLGFGSSQLTIWDHRSGDVIMNFDFEIKLGRNLGSNYYPDIDISQNDSNSGMLLLFQLLQRVSPDGLYPELLIIACTISHSSPSFRILQRHTLPVPQFVRIKNAISTGEHLIITGQSDEEIWININHPSVITSIPSQNTTRFYGHNNNQLIELTNKTLTVDSFVNHIIKLTAVDENKTTK